MKKRLILLIAMIFQMTAVFANDLLPLRDPFIPIVLIAPHVSIIQQQSCWIPIYFSRAEHIADFLSKKNLHVLSDEGQINSDPQTNQLWVQDDMVHMRQIKALIHHLDQPGPQFLIKAKIINLDRDYQKALGVLFQTNTQANTPSIGLSMDRPNANNTTGEFSLSIAKFSNNQLLDMQISALEQEGHASLISSPSLTTLNNAAALIESGAEVPYQETTLNGGTGVRFKKAVLRLEVTPQKMPGDHILLHISLNQDKVSALTVKGVPAIQTQQITTQVIVRANQTVVLGGILETEKAAQTEGIPVLSAIPVMGKLFQHDTMSRQQRELLIFITPSMMKVY